MSHPQQMRSQIADNALGHRHVFIRDLCLEALIGIHTHERGTHQPIRVNIDLTVAEGGPLEDHIEAVVDYEAVAGKARGICTEGHVNLVETLAERIAAACLEDTRVVAARVRVEKLKAIEDTTSVGVEIERWAAGR